MCTVQCSEVEQSISSWVGDKAPLITPWPRRLASTREYSQWGPLLSSQPALQSPPVLKKGLLACDENHPSCFFMVHDSRAKDQQKFFTNPTVPNLLIHFQRPQRAPSPRRRCRPPLPEEAAGLWEALMPTLESSPTRYDSDKLADVKAGWTFAQNYLCSAHSYHTKNLWPNF